MSAFQVHIADYDIVTPGDTPNVLVAMNPAALKANVRRPVPGATIIVNVDAFEARNLEKAGYRVNPLEDGSLDAFTRVRGADDVDDQRGGQGHRREAP